MKRITSACLHQTIHFPLRTDIEPFLARRTVREEYAHMKEQLEQSNTPYTVEDEIVEPDGSITIRMLKQYRHYDCSDYLDI